MFAKIMAWLFTLVDLTVSLDGDILSIVVELGSIKVLDLQIDLVKDENEVSAVKSLNARRVK
jgi:hypothetical protein